MDYGPEHPGEPAGEFDFAEFCDGAISSYYGQGTFVEVFEGDLLFVPDMAGDAFAGIFSLLHGGGGDAGQGGALFVTGIGDVADDINIWPAGGIEHVIYDHAAGAVGFDVALFGEKLSEG